MKQTVKLFIIVLVLSIFLTMTPEGSSANKEIIAAKEKKLAVCKQECNAKRRVIEKLQTLVDRQYEPGRIPFVPG